MLQETTVSKMIAMRDDCICLSARRRARYLTRAYDDLLTPSGLKLTQFSTVAVLVAGPLSITKLANALDLDRTTLSRNLSTLEKKGYIHLSDSSDARERQIGITPLGKEAAQSAYVLWQQAQALYASPGKA